MNGFIEAELSECQNLPVCSENCELGQWSTWSECSENCLDTREYNYPSRTRSRELIKNLVGEGICLSTLDKQSTCPSLRNCPIDGVWSEWTKYQDCDKSCGEGKETYKRYCKGRLYGGKDCIGTSEKEETCILKSCICDLSQWSQWSDCDTDGVGCGKGIRTRKREVLNPHSNCIVKSSEEFLQKENCYTRHCTSEFLKLQKITIEVLEARYPGTNKNWELKISDRNGKFTCIISGNLQLYQGKKTISGIDLGDCSLPDKKLVLKDFMEMPQLHVELRTQKKTDCTFMNRLDVVFCRTWAIGAYCYLDFKIEHQSCKGHRNGIIGENGVVNFYCGCLQNELPNQIRYNLYYHNDQMNNFQRCFHVKVCRASLYVTSGFKQVKYFHDNNGWYDNVGIGILTNIYLNSNKIKLGRVKLDFCTPNCDNGKAEYLYQNDAPQQPFEMKFGVSLSAHLQNTCKSFVLTFPFLLL